MSLRFLQKDSIRLLWGAGKGLLVLAITGWLACGAPPPPAQEGPDIDRPMHLGLALPYPLSLVPHTSAYPPRQLGDSLVPVVLTIDTGGAVADARPTREGDSLLIEFVQERLAGFTFEPGRLNDSTVQSILHATLRISGARSSLLFPVDRLGNIADQHLYFESFRANGFAFPKLLRFPSYYTTIKTKDSVYTPPYVLFRVRIDTSGVPASVALDDYSYPYFHEQLRSAVNWAEFAPVDHSAKHPVDSVLLAVFMYPEFRGRTLAHDSAMRASTNPLARRRVLTFPFKAGLLHLPVPRNLSEGQFLGLGTTIPRDAKAAAVITVDTSGTAAMLSANLRDPVLNGFLRDAVNRLRFYPAVDFDGRPRLFRGSLSVYLTADSKIVRIVCDWLQT